MAKFSEGMTVYRVLWKEDRCGIQAGTTVKTEKTIKVLIPSTGEIGPQSKFSASIEEALNIEARSYLFIGGLGLASRKKRDSIDPWKYVAILTQLQRLRRDLIDKGFIV